MYQTRTTVSCLLIQYYGGQQREKKKRNKYAYTTIKVNENNIVWMDQHVSVTYKIQ